MTGVAAMRNGRRPPIGVRRRSDHAPATSGSQSASSPSMPMMTPMTIIDPTNS